MKKLIVSVVLSTVSFAIAFAQQDSGGKTLAATIEVYVFPTSGQEAQQQSMHEAECYEWAATNTGNDPFELTQLQAEQSQDTEEAKQAAAQSTAGAGVRGAARGAAAGALIGEIADDDAGKGAAYGAAAGAIVSRRRAHAASQQAQAQAEASGQARQQASAEQIDNFKKAFSVCLEAKEYLVKY
jgi:hypothetical protein